MRRISTKYCIFALALIGLFAAASVASAQSAIIDKVMCVPWQGDPSKYHTAFSDTSVTLKGVIKTTDTSTIYYKWVYGDGSSDAGSLSGSTKYNVPASHTYTGAMGSPFAATLQVSTNASMTDPVPVTCNYKVILEDSASLDANINVAIDKGLWWLYTNNNTDPYLYSYNGQPVMAWYQWSSGNFWASPTASAIQAFAINNHKFHGDPDKDPYVEAVRLGMNWLTNGYRYYTSSPMLNAVSITPVDRGGGLIDDPEATCGTTYTQPNCQTSPNGYGIQVLDYNNSHFPYQGGQIMDAIIASGVSPTDLTGRDFTKTDNTIGHNWTYGELLQDMADMYAWGQSDSVGCNSGICGSWWYDWNSGFPGDNSASQWAAIGMIPAQQAPWNVILPQWVKTYNANWLAYSMGCSGPSSSVTACTYNYFSYNGVGGCAGDSCMQTTTSGMVQMIFDGQTTADTKWGLSHLYIADNWKYFTDYGSTWGGYKTYGWYSFVKAMRLSLPTATTQLVKTSGATFDWYYGNPNPIKVLCTMESNCERGLASRILETQSSDGSWQSGNLTNPPLTTAWMIITLRPTLFQAAPIACFTAKPNPTYANAPITFDPSCSGHSEAGKSITNLTKFEWDWNNDGTYDLSTTTPSTVTHGFPCDSLPCSYTVTLKVTDDVSPTALTATIQQVINITVPPHPPVANAGGPYMVSLCPTDSLTLDGSKSFDPDQGNCSGTNCSPDHITAWDWGLNQQHLNDFNDKHGSMVTLSAADIATYFTAGLNSAALRVTDNTLLSFPGTSGTPNPNMTDANFATVQVYSCGLRSMTAVGRIGKVLLKWAPTGAASYDVFRSTQVPAAGAIGPNTSYVKIGTASAYGSYQDSDPNLNTNTTYYYRVVDSNGKSALPVNAKPVQSLGLQRHTLDSEE